jgi:hypothetical protein
MGRSPSCSLASTNRRKLLFALFGSWTVHVPEPIPQTQERRKRGFIPGAPSSVEARNRLIVTFKNQWISSRTRAFLKCCILPYRESYDLLLSEFMHLSNKISSVINIDSFINIYFYLISARGVTCVRCPLRAAVDFSSNMRRYLLKSYIYILPYGPSPASSCFLAISLTTEKGTYIYTHVRACYLSAISLTEDGRALWAIGSLHPFWNENDGSGAAPSTGIKNS